MTPKGQEGLLSGVRLLQVHGNSLLFDPEPWEQGDAMITSKKNLRLIIRHADCLALLFYDKKQGVIGAAHAGWRGLCGGVISAVVEGLIKKGSALCDIEVAISPGLGPCHAEFKGFKDYFPPHFWPFELSPNHFDLQAIARFELFSLGLSQIELFDKCTFCHDDLYSYRRDPQNSGRHESYIQLMD